MSFNSSSLVDLAAHQDPRREFHGIESNEFHQIPPSNLSNNEESRRQQSIYQQVVPLHEFMGKYIPIHDREKLGLFTLIRRARHHVEKENGGPEAHTVDQAQIEFAFTFFGECSRFFHLSRLC